MHAKILSNGILKISYLENFLLEYKINYSNSPDCIIGWGYRPTSKKAREYAKNHHLPYVALEDGFLRSVGLGVDSYPPFSLVYDNVGIYYDTTQPSLLEKYILESNFSDIQLANAQKALDLICRYQLSKYNQAVDFVENFANNKEKVLVIDQTFGDMAVKYGQADETHFQQMLEAAISENPNAEIWVKTHPDVLTGKKKGYLTDLSHYADNVKIIAQDLNPLSLLSQVDKVYCVTSQMGFEALLINKKVITFGVPWFAGWGLTEDRHPNVSLLTQGNRREVRSLLALFCAAYLKYCRYIDPNTGQTGTIFDVIEYLYKMKLLNRRLAGNLYCVGMSLWKRAAIKPFFNLPSCRLHFVRSQKKLENRPLAENAKLLIWGEGKPELHQFAEKHHLPILRMEDGFIRSVGLGSNLVPPLSLVIDDLGIYFNAQKPSRLEHILQTQTFSDDDLTLAEQLRDHLIQNHIGKYNVGVDGYKVQANNQKVILVPGQVEDDASIRLGSPKIQTNLALLKAVRQHNPDAYIIYKPHPDVVSGNREGHIEQNEALKYANEIVSNANILDCIMQSSEVHTMTSLAGFEALLRGKTVHCYGLPFYSNWGLTVDKIELLRRTRQLSLNELIAGTLIYYPLYISSYTHKFIDVKNAIDILAQRRRFENQENIRVSWFVKQIHKLQQLYRVLK
ncbi:capsular polysaccharide biosynthesis protein [[Haemophilus] felis]|uniref:Beta-3-deoxy-D-manno-oct-2-ulosonic acid transferase n=1 Tax=[Haemophilus] felis TaxID=123822 RepID=A0A1T0AW44_9PAST|nr:capsular polysaccharide biosynthesis protein [[Haemophilus] felis]OOS01865.1 beta-3-deoxy-D-manno-oct-2-ulosonic acid transferase [[Haemophilus] felis]